MQTDIQQQSGGTIAAIFPDTKSAHDAMHRLHKADFRDTWLGVVHGNANRPDAMTLDAESKGTGAVRGLASFFALSKDEDPATAKSGNRRSLHQTLHERGVAEADLQHIESTLTPGCAVVTVDAKNDAMQVRQIVRECGGSLSGEASPRLTTATTLPGVDETPSRNAMAQPGMSVAPNSLNPNLDGTDPIIERNGDLEPMPVVEGTKSSVAGTTDDETILAMPVFYEEVFILLPDEDELADSRLR
jgi:hypothetical protein